MQACRQMSRLITGLVKDLEETASFGENLSMEES
jgi:hypothetical protein